jgi:hypothetical protein
MILLRGVDIVDSIGLHIYPAVLPLLFSRIETLWSRSFRKAADYFVHSGIWRHELWMRRGSLMRKAGRPSPLPVAEESV